MYIDGLLYVKWIIVVLTPGVYLSQLLINMVAEK